MKNKLIKYRSNGIKVIKFNIGNNNYDKTMVYYKNGNPQQEKNYKNGNPQQEKNYKNGNLNGNLISYWENGRVHTKGKYQNNHRIGTWKTYDKKGNLVLKENY